MTAFDVTIRNAAAQAVLDQLAQRATNLRPALLEIGEDILAITKGAFATSTSPWGERWTPNTEATILAHLAKFSGSYSKRTGRITATGSRRTINKKPLIGETRSLVGDIYSRVDGNTLTVGSPMVYAAIHQFGGRAGKGKKVEIPARPFLPANDAGGLAPVAHAAVMDVLERYLK